MKQKTHFCFVNLRTEKKTAVKKKDVTCDLLCKQVPTLQACINSHVYSCIQAKILKSIILLEREDNSKKKIKKK